MWIFMNCFVSNEERGDSMGNSTFFKLVCVDENDVFEYKILEDVNKATLDEVHIFVEQNIHKHKNAKWLLLPCEIVK